MKKIKYLALVGLLLSVTTPARAGQINQQLACKAQLTHVKNKLPLVVETYSSSDLAIIKKGVNAYLSYLDVEHIEPAMKQFSNLDAQVDAMQTTMVQNFDKRYPQPRYFMDNAMVLNNCYQGFTPTKLQSNTAVQAMIKKIAEVSQ